MSGTAGYTERYELTCELRWIQLGDQRHLEQKRIIHRMDAETGEPLAPKEEWNPVPVFIGRLEYPR